MVKLLYIWIEESSNGFIKESGFNIGGEYFYKYNHDERKLSFNKKVGYVKEFWGNNINELSVIVGANGAGKSTLLTEIMRLEAKGNKGKKIVVYEYKEKIYYMHNLQEKIITEPWIEYRQMDEWWGTIFVSNSMEETIHAAEYSNAEVDKYALNDITLRMERNKIMEDFELNKSMSRLWKNMNKNNQMFRFYSLDMMVNLDKIGQYENVDNIIKLFFLTHSSLTRYGIDREEKVFIGINNITSVNRYDNNNNFISNILKNNEECFFDRLLICFYKELNFFFEEEFGDNKEIVSIQDICKKLKDMIKQNKTKKIKKDFAMEEYFLEAAEDLIQLKNIVNKSAVIVDEEKENYLVVKFSENKDFFCKIFDVLRQNRASFVLRYLSFRLETRASGEEALLKFYSRMYWMFNTKYQKNNILLLIDEVDLYMHPQWQRILINALIEDVREIFGDGKEIQIVITTHSPIILSDIPKANIVFLKKEKGYCQVDSNENHRETFGNNVHTLFLDSFFLDDKGTIGEFAEKKINEIIKLLHEKNKETMDYENIEAIIECVGDSLIKKKLMELFKKKERCNYEKRTLSSVTDEKARDRVIGLLRSQINDLQKMIDELEDR